MRKVSRDSGGYIVVETTCSFLLFVLLIFSILRIINIVTIQARVHYALTQTAETLSLYSYVLERTGLAEHMLNSAAKAEDMQGELDQMKASINGVIDGLEQLEPSQVGMHGKAAVEQGKAWVQKTATEPKAVLQDVLNYALKNAEGAALEMLARPIMDHYLANGSDRGDTYLRMFGVSGGIDDLEFYQLKNLSLVGSRNSTLLTSSGDVKLVVEYDVDYSFGALMLPFSKLHITQEVMTKAWLGGTGEGYPKA